MSSTDIITALVLCEIALLVAEATLATVALCFHFSKSLTKMAPVHRPDTF